MNCLNLNLIDIICCRIKKQPIITTKMLKHYKIEKRVVFKFILFDSVYFQKTENDE